MDDQRLNKVKKFYYRNKRLPSWREMSKLFEVSSPSAISWLVSKWKEQNIITIEGHKLAPGDEFFRLPLLGVIKAGEPTDSGEQYATESISLDKYLVGNPGYTYLLRVSGDSMQDEGIKTGDLVILDKKKEPKNGDIVAAFVDGQWTLKYFQKKTNQITLVAANKKYRPIVPKMNLEIGGVVVKVIREYY